MHVPIGPIHYELKLVAEPRSDRGERVRGLCDGHHRRILIDEALPVEQRFYEFWHEFGHAIKFELDVHDAELVGHEPLARIIALGMSKLSVKTMARVQLYLRDGIEASDVMLLQGRSEPIPILKISESDGPSSRG